MHNPDMLPEVAVLLAAHSTGGAVLVMHVAYMALQVCLEVAAIATVTTLEVFNLKHGQNIRLYYVYLNVLLIDMMPEVGEFYLYVLLIDGMPEVGEFNLHAAGLIRCLRLVNCTCMCCWLIC